MCRAAPPVLSAMSAAEGRRFNCCVEHDLGMISASLHGLPIVMYHIVQEVLSLTSQLFIVALLVKKVGNGLGIPGG
jgi:hypothetical protein